MAAALSLRVPTMAFEPNAMPGLANRLVGKRVQAAAVNFPARREVLPQRRGDRHSGPPRILQGSTARRRATPHLLVFGGSQGARLFNVAMPQIVAALFDAVPGLTILHQSGARHAESPEAAYRASGADPARWQVSPFLTDMPARFAKANLVMSRSGASTVAELAAAGQTRPCLFRLPRPPTITRNATPKRWSMPEQQSCW